MTDQPWQQLPLNRLLVYRDGIRVYEGTDHQKEFFEEMGAPYIEALLKKIGENKSRHGILACLLCFA